MSTQITIEGIEQPREGAKMGSVKAGGRYYKVWPDKLDGFAVGSTYVVETESGEFKGKPWTKIKTSKLVNGSGNGASKPNVTSSAHHVDGRSEPVTSKDAYWTRKEQNDLAKQPRIERQHAQEMALRYFHIRGTIPEDNMTAVRAMVDWFQRDVGHVPTAPVTREPVAANGDNEGDFQL